MPREKHRIPAPRLVALIPPRPRPVAETILKSKRFRGFCYCVSPKVSWLSPPGVHFMCVLLGCPRAAIVALLSAASAWCVGLGCGGLGRLEMGSKCHGTNRYAASFYQWAGDEYAHSDDVAGRTTGQPGSRARTATREGQSGQRDLLSPRCARGATRKPHQGRLQHFRRRRSAKYRFLCAQRG